MKKQFLALIAVGLMVAAGAAGQIKATDDRPKDEAAIRELISAIDKAANNHDAKALATFFATDADSTNPVGMTFSGRRDIEESYRPLFSGDTSRGNPSLKDTVFTSDPAKIRFLRPEIASVDFRWTQTGTVGPDGRALGTRKGLINLVVTRDEGRWQVAVMYVMDLSASPPPRR